MTHGLFGHDIQVSVANLGYLLLVKFSLCINKLSLENTFDSKIRRRKLFTDSGICITSLPLCKADLCQKEACTVTP